MLLPYILLVLSFSPDINTPGFTLNLELNDVVFTDASTLPPTEFDDPNEAQIRSNINSWFDYAANRGVNIVLNHYI